VCVRVLGCVGCEGGVGARREGAIDGHHGPVADLRGEEGGLRVEVDRGRCRGGNRNELLAVPKCECIKHAVRYEARWPPTPHNAPPSVSCSPLPPPTPPHLTRSVRVPHFPRRDSGALLTVSKCLCIRHAARYEARLAHPPGNAHPAMHHPPPPCPPASNHPVQPPFRLAHALTASKCLCIRHAVRYDAPFSSRKKAPKSPPCIAASTRSAICMLGAVRTAGGRLASRPKRTSGSAEETR
jgi:hypothetical protein